MESQRQYNLTLPQLLKISPFSQGVCKAFIAGLAHLWRQRALTGENNE